MPKNRKEFLNNASKWLIRSCIILLRKKAFFFLLKYLFILPICHIIIRIHFNGMTECITYLQRKIKQNENIPFPVKLYRL